jgi:hypothetical protein
MPKINIDYSNTIFYKIYCKDISIKDLYIGHTTNFVQRKYSHKQGCINPKSSNYKCKLYNVIRDNMGWDNWKMEIIAFHNCEDLYSAKKQEQYYFEKYNATLNSIEPLPQQNPRQTSIVDKIPREPLYCRTCNVYFNTRKLQDEHNKRPRHIKLLQYSNENLIIEKNNITSKKYQCEKCNFKCSNKQDYTRHILTPKHNRLTNPNETLQKTPNIYICNCGKKYKHRSSLCKHKKNCSMLGINDTHNEPTINPIENPSIVIELLKQNQEFKDLILEERREFQKIIKKML